jgi:hypothetical protein
MTTLALFMAKSLQLINDRRAPSHDFRESIWQDFQSKKYEGTAPRSADLV